MKREPEITPRKKPHKRERSRNFFDDDGFAPNKKAMLNQYKRKQKHRKIQEWED